MSAIRYEDIMLHLVGLDAWLTAAGRSLSRLDRPNIERQIPLWIRNFERETQYRINQVQVVSAPDGTYDTPTTGAGTLTSAGALITGTGTAFTSVLRPDMSLRCAGLDMPVKSIESDTALTLYDAPPVPYTTAAYSFFPLPLVKADGYPYHRTDAKEFGMTTLRERPVQSIQRVRYLLNGQRQVLQLPPQWFSFEKSGRFWIVPLYAAAAITGLASAMAIYGTLMADYMPNFVYFDYIAGLPYGWQYSSEYSDVRLALESFCALQVLGYVDQAFGAGLSGKSVSSAVGNQNFQYTRFQDKKQELTAQYQAFKDNFVMQNTPFLLDYL